MVDRPRFIIPDPTVAHINFLSEENIARQAELMATERFEGLEMLQKFSLAHHIVRVDGMSTVVAYALSEMGQDVDPLRAIWKADIHDEPERRTGDMPTPVKEAMSMEERQDFDAWEDKIMVEFEKTLDIPTWAESPLQMYQDHRKKEKIEDRIVNFFDKWDASNELVHEIVCGNGEGEIVEILERYRRRHNDSRLINDDWIPQLETIFGKDIFTVPSPEDIHKRNVDDLSFESAKDFILSVSGGNPDSYALWLSFNSYFWGPGFIKMTFPGWEEKMPEVIIQALELYREGKREFLSPSGLLIVSEEAKKAMSFAHSLGNRTISPILEMIDERV